MKELEPSKDKDKERKERKNPKEQAFGFSNVYFQAFLALFL